MQVQRVQNNNYNQTFGAKVTILDADKIIPKGVKRTFTKMCRDLGKDTDEICLMVSKGDRNVNGLETDGFFGIVNKGLQYHIYAVNTTNLGCMTDEQFAVIGDKFLKETSFMEYLPVWTNREYSMPRNLAKIYKDYILPVFEGNYIRKSLSEAIDAKLSAVAKSKN